MVEEVKVKPQVEHVEFLVGNPLLFRPSEIVHRRRIDIVFNEVLS